MISKNQIKLIRSLETKKSRKSERLFVAEGPKVVGDLLQAGFLPHSVFSTSSRPDSQQITEEELKRISFLQHPQEVLALFHIQLSTESRTRATLVLSFVLPTGLVLTPSTVRLTLPTYIIRK